MNQAILKPMLPFQTPILTVLLLVAIQCCGIATSRAADDNPSVIELFGDSISQGYNNAFVAQYGSFERFGNGETNYGQPDILLSNILNDSGRPSLVANYGAGGTASGESFNPGIVSLFSGLDRVTPSTIRIKSLYPGKAYYLLIMYGTNDYGYSIGASTTGFNIGLIIDEAKAQGFIPIVGTIPPCSCQSVSSVNASIAANVSAKNSPSSPVYFADHYSKLVAANWPALNDDGIHPNDAGYLVIAQNWFDSALKGLIDEEIPFSIAPIINLLLDD